MFDLGLWHLCGRHACIASLISKFLFLSTVIKKPFIPPWANRQDSSTKLDLYKLLSSQFILQFFPIPPRHTNTHTHSLLVLVLIDLFPFTRSLGSGRSAPFPLVYLSNRMQVVRNRTDGYITYYTKHINFAYFNLVSSQTTTHTPSCSPPQMRSNEMKCSWSVRGRMAKDKWVLCSVILFNRFHIL